MKNFFATLFSAVTAVPLCSCSAKIVEVKDVAPLEVKQISCSPVKIKLSGLVRHSAYGVSDVRTFESGEFLQVIVYAKVANNKYSGSFSHILTVPEGVNTTTFGNDKTIIWSRHNKKFRENFLCPQ